VQQLHWQQGGATHITACDAIAFGHGLRSETQLADLAGCAFDFDALDQAWLPRRDAPGAAACPVSTWPATAPPSAVPMRPSWPARGCAGAAAGPGRPPRPSRTPRLARAAPQRRFREGLETLCPLPADWAAQAADALVVCRCEEITAGELRACVRDTGTRELNRLKALTRIGMGRCQGRMCAPAAARLLADAAGCALAEVGRLRSQPPVKPVPVAALGAALAQAAPVPPGERDD
jgi:hydrogen cyanide synthase HcnB